MDRIKDKQALGRHVLIELYDCDVAVLKDEPAVRRILVEAARLAGATVVAETFHTFNPHGVSGVVVIAESHVTIHTWPEHQYAAVDVFSCGASIRPEKVHDHVREQMKAKRTASLELERGLFGAAKKTT